MIEKTVFFVKPNCENPFIDEATALEIVAFLEDELRADGEGEFVRLSGKRTRPLPLEFWYEFYAHIREIVPEIYEKMCREFANREIALFVYQGPNIAERIKRISGPTQYKDNIGRNTIRNRWGNPDIGYRTIVHASDRGGVKHDFAIMRKWEIFKD